MNIIAPINDLGYGVVARNLIKELYKIDNGCKLYPLGNCDPFTPIEQRMIEQGRIIDRDRVDLRIWHQYDMGYFLSNKRKIGLTFFELDRLTRYEVSHLNSLDILFVPSEWAKKICIESGVNKCDIRILCMGVDLDIFPAINTEYAPFNGYDSMGNMVFEPTDNSKPTVFITCGKWEIRKGHDIIIKAFEDTFGAGENVKLIVNCYNPFISNNDEWCARYTTNRPHQVHVITQRLRNQYDLSRIYQMVDCGLFPARAEGFNLEAAELLAMGKECIMTDYSGHTAFAKDAGARLIDIDNLELANDGVFFNSNDPKWEGKPGRWAELGEKQLSDLRFWMHHIDGFKQGKKLVRNNKGVEFFKNNTWEKAAKTIYEACN